MEAQPGARPALWHRGVMASDAAQFRQELLELKTNGDDLEFCKRVEAVDGTRVVAIVKALFDAFRPECETGVQQTVMRVLESVPLGVYYQAYAESLARWVEEGDGWEIELAAHPSGSAFRLQTWS